MKAPRENPAGSVTEARVAYRTVKIEGLDIFYREAGCKDAPVVLLLHGFPNQLAHVPQPDPVVGRRVTLGCA
jgi:hypothetical protein